MVRSILMAPYRLLLAALVTLVSPAVFFLEAVEGGPEEAMRVIRDAYIEIWSI